MHIFDNMGGFISAEFILQSEVASFSKSGNTAAVVLIAGASWKKLFHQHNGIKPSVSVTNPDAGKLAAISGSIILKRTDPNLDILRKNKYILLRITSANKEVKIYGSDEYPVQVSLSPLSPATPSAFSGYDLALSGSQEFEPLFLAV
jgi:hypothetical protein